MDVHRRLFAWLCCTLPPALAALTIAACGGSSPASSSSSATSAVHGGSGDSASSLPGHSHRSTSRDIVSAGTVTQRPLRGTGGSEANDENAGRTGSADGTAGGPNPCKLVSKAQAQAIVGVPIATPQEAPLGPTCIYQARGGKETITVAVESLEFAKIRSKIHGTMRATMGGHTAYCGDYGRPTTFVPLTQGKVLNVSAPCAIGTRFAEQALRRLGNSS
ncbi:MAG TPA: hypothetical protein VNY27_09680 [Solirubrobacteraceae bacterium]|jgi:hypothetical protein|nr:hypothetical protein [Solirubrobacteraceae bacterium]